MLDMCRILAIGRNLNYSDTAYRIRILAATAVDDSQMETRVSVSCTICHTLPKASGLDVCLSCASTPQGQVLCQSCLDVSVPSGTKVCKDCEQWLAEHKIATASASRCTKDNGTPCYDKDITCVECWGNWAGTINDTTPPTPQPEPKDDWPEYIIDLSNGLRKCCAVSVRDIIKTRKVAALAPPLSGHRIVCTKCRGIIVLVGTNTWRWGMR